MEDFPPNSKKAQEGAREAPKRVERVTSGDVVRRRKPLGKQFKSTFFGGDMRTAFEYVITQVIVPAIRDTIADAATSGIEKLIFGEGRSSRRRGAGPPAGATGYVSYNRMSGSVRGDDRPPMPSRRASARHDFDDIVLSSRSDAEEVLDRLFDVLNRYEAVTVADLYELAGVQSTHTDHKWGWTDLHGAAVERLRNGSYLLDLPRPEALD